MLLAIDVGNTNIVGGVFKDSQLLFTFRIQTVQNRTEDEYGVIFRTVLANRSFEQSSIDRVILSSVVPSLAPAITGMAKGLFRVDPMVLGPALYPYLPVKVIAPAEMGTDLVANAVAAFEQVRGACIVVDFGTALTFTALDASGEIRGVAIAPGLGSAVGSLSHDTAQLPRVPLECPASVLGKNTVQAIQAGILHGYIGMVEHLVRRISQEMAEEAKVVATGGLCRVVSPHTKIFNVVEPNLTLYGLETIARIIRNTERIGG
jgi:type III pantothenate kinase